MNINELMTIQSFKKSYYKISLLFLLLPATFSSLFADEFKVISFIYKPMSTAALEHEMIDVNDRKCALIIVYTDIDLSNAIFDANPMVCGSRNTAPGEWWVYAVPRCSKIQIKKEGFIPLNFHIPNDIEIESSKVYEMKLTSNEMLNWKGLGDKGKIIVDKGYFKNANIVVLKDKTPVRINQNGILETGKYTMEITDNSGCPNLYKELHFEVFKDSVTRVFLNNYSRKVVLKSFDDFKLLQISINDCKISSKENFRFEKVLFEMENPYYLVIKDASNYVFKTDIFLKTNRETEFFVQKKIDVQIKGINDYNDCRIFIDKKLCNINNMPSLLAGNKYNIEIQHKDSKKFENQSKEIFIDADNNPAPVGVQFENFRVNSCYRKNQCRLKRNVATGSTVALLGLGILYRVVADANFKEYENLASSEDASALHKKIVFQDITSYIAFGVAIAVSVPTVKLFKKYSINYKNVKCH